MLDTWRTYYLKKPVSDSGPEISNAAPVMFTLNLFSLCSTLLLLVIYLVCYLKVLLVAKIVETSVMNEWVWSIGEMILTAGNRTARRKICLIATLCMQVPLGLM